ncbi:antibiotic biosynthesis monooxygenase family protein [Epidermidibacterium keratini]|uniref:antibiotic biosynthesis monooxygenase family protein n=1 Tax=Epidermidibacterium keratini TaxID=1891644 RepID=UPI0018659DCD|nr:antibiotic biosynthesis monooxygenase [Epidermidibacterium keratini]
MLVVVRFEPPEDLDDFIERAERALAAFAACRGHQRGWLARSTDEPETWLVCTLWDNVGAYRRALSAYDVKLHANPLMYTARDEVSAFETVLESGPDGVRALGTDRAPDATSTAIGDFGPRGPGNPGPQGSRRS